MMNQNTTSVGYIGDLRDIDKNTINAKLTYEDLLQWLIKSKGAATTELFYDKKYENNYHGVIDRLNKDALLLNIDLRTTAVNSVDAFAYFVNDIKGEKAIKMISENNPYKEDILTYLQRRNIPITDTQVFEMLSQTDLGKAVAVLPDINTIAQDTVGNYSSGPTSGMPDTHIKIADTQSTLHVKKSNNTYISVTTPDSLPKSVAKNIIHNASKIHNAYGTITTAVDSVIMAKEMTDAAERYDIKTDSLNHAFEQCMKKTHDINNQAMFARDDICIKEFGGNKQLEAFKGLYNDLVDISGQKDIINYIENKNNNTDEIGQENFARD